MHLTSDVSKGAFLVLLDGERVVEKFDIQAALNGQPSVKINNPKLGILELEASDALPSDVPDYMYVTVTTMLEVQEGAEITISGRRVSGGIFTFTHLTYCGKHHPKHAGDSWKLDYALPTFLDDNVPALA